MLRNKEPNSKIMKKANSRIKISVVGRDLSVGKNEDHSESECDIESEQQRRQNEKTDTAWKIGCYKINPSTPLGK